MNLNFRNLPKRTHIAIMRESWKLLPKILSGEKTIESRWYKTRRAPWDQISVGDIIYFKDSGEPVTVRARVSRIEQFVISSNEEALMIMKRYAVPDLGTAAITEQTKAYIFGKRYAILVYFDSVEEIEPFDINKAGFGVQAAWLIVDDIDRTRKVESKPKG